MNPRLRLFALASVTALVPLGAGLYSLEAPTGPEGTDLRGVVRGSDDPSEAVAPPAASGALLGLEAPPRSGPVQPWGGETMGARPGASGDRAGESGDRSGSAGPGSDRPAGSGRPTSLPDSTDPAHQGEVTPASQSADLPRRDAQELAATDAARRLPGPWIPSARRSGLLV
ncbi:MAG TPA: hypothetical protein VK858_10670 [Longimicrobiales bacterium]|nr:hypothetical protein [Longimicrobiales bacterium]